MKKTRFILCYILGFGGWMLIRYFLNGSYGIIDSLGLPVNFYHRLLIQLSKGSKMNQIIAWLVYLIVSFLPLVYLSVKRKWRQKGIRNTMISLSVFLLFATYGALNGFFTNPYLISYNYSNLNRYRLVIDCLITGVIVLTILVAVILNVKQSKNIRIEEKNLYIFLHIIGGINGVLGAASLIESGSFDGVGFLTAIPSAVFYMFSTVFMLYIAYAIGVSFIMYIKEGISQNLLTQIQEISKWSFEVILFSIIGSISLAVLKLILAAALVNNHTTFTLPIMELSFYFASYWITRILTQAYQLSEENKQFV